MKLAILISLVTLFAVACSAPPDPSQTSSTLQAETELGIAWRAPELATAVCDAAAQCQPGSWAYDYVAERGNPAVACPDALKADLDGAEPPAVVSRAVDELVVAPCAPLPPTPLGSAKN